MDKAWRILANIVEWTLGELENDEPNYMFGKLWERNSNYESDESSKDGTYPEKFMIRDDDGVLYFIGEAELGCEFEPLDQLGILLGATEIWYWSTKELDWKML